MRNKMTPVVAEDQIENVGIMQGFMDDIEEMMGEIDADMAPDPDDVDGIAMILGRTPDSPEILMNNLRGDYRSVDARREELADLVGYNAAAETPDQVLALLQPVLAQQMAQGIGAIEPPPMPMGDMPMPDGGIGGLPAQMDPMMQMQQDPMMQMQQDPMMQMQQDPMMQMQQDPMMGAPVPMATGGMVQRFQEGSGPAGVTRSSPSALDEFLARQGQASIDPMARTKELSPAYRELLGLGAGADRSGMAFDIAQAALGYAANIGPDGQPLRGSGAARLAGAARALPGQIGARAEAARQDETRARMAALQQAQSEQAAVQASNLALSAEQRAILLEREKRADPTTGFQTLHQRAIAGGLEPGTENYQRFMIDGAQQAGFSLSIGPDGSIQVSQGGGLGGSSPTGAVGGVGAIPPGMALIETEDGLELVVIPGSPAAQEQADAERKALGRQAQIARAGGTVVQDLQRALDLIPDLGVLARNEGIAGGVTRAGIKRIPGSLEYQITEFTESALSNVGLDTLQQMRDNSPTGGALGQVPIQQQKRLEQVLGSLNVNQRPTQLDANIKRVINIYTDIIHGSPMERAAAVEQGRMTPEESMEIDNLYFELPFDERGRAIDSRAQPVVQPRPTRLVYDAQGNLIQ